MAECKVDSPAGARGIGNEPNLATVLRWHELCRSKFMWSVNKHYRERMYMLGWTIIFLMIALLAGVLGFTGIAGAAIGIAKIIFAIFLALFLLSLLFRPVAK